MVEHAFLEHTQHTMTAHTLYEEICRELERQPNILLIIFLNCITSHVSTDYFVRRRRSKRSVAPWYFNERRFYHRSGVYTMVSGLPGARNVADDSCCLVGMTERSIVLRRRPLHYYTERVIANGVNHRAKKVAKLRLYSDRTLNALPIATPAVHVDCHVFDEIIPAWFFNDLLHN